MENNIELKKLYDPLPSVAITTHPTKTYLSSIKAIYVTERFNEVFGIGKWSTKVEKEYLNHETGMVVVKVVFQVKSLDIYYESYGGNDNGGTNNKNFDLGDAYKGATTDAITKIGSYLGVAIDVFKGKNDNKPASNNDSPWLNKTDSSKNITKEWRNVIAGINGGKIKDLKDIRQHYKVNKTLAEELQNAINLTPAA